ncbi:MAG: hypothetical protein COT17_05225 [Elusimicrobia bacterium CG08_land_8_20_14_0_20_51_18]|nr:MAG: hypothetical protein COT17_05225 [Elusimicrobia bacterium CG08_land_8_20_14_0_20_51_18]
MSMGGIPPKHSARIPPRVNPWSSAKADKIKKPPLKEGRLTELPSEKTAPAGRCAIDRTNKRE